VNADEHEYTNLELTRLVIHQARQIEQLKRETSRLAAALAGPELDTGTGVSRADLLLGRP
jgi:hypothetical protein